ncbi:hypothetical protein HALLA_13630 [Halostagnicola larsenii XH-48]|uniref:Uncharacterized protein n=1 Tax=Halostagnicola larsenii XH-48 TaxID=797299 RepID=W0JQM7_9EURY|nr:hypothetical protein HALLA_13630 [Halostagnicola larsenii XH-48]
MFDGICHEFLYKHSSNPPIGRDVTVDRSTNRISWESI